MYWTSWAALSHSIPTFHSVSLGKCARTRCTYNKTCLQQLQAFVEAQNHAQCKFPACILIFKQKPTLFLAHHARLTKDEASSGYMHHHTFYMYIYTSLSNCGLCTVPGMVRDIILHLLVEHGTPKLPLFPWTANKTLVGPTTYMYINTLQRTHVIACLLVPPQLPTLWYEFGK